MKPPYTLPHPDDPRGRRLKEQGYLDGDFYFTPEGYVVFTEQYLLRRGYCCGNKCRHCPYGHEAVRKVQGGHR